jgi:hypothetical protein
MPERNVRTDNDGMPAMLRLYLVREVRCLHAAVLGRARWFTKVARK